MKTVKAKLILALAVPMLMFGSMAAKAEKLEVLRIGLLPTEQGLEMIKQFDDIAKHLSKALGVPYKIQVTQSYNALIEAMDAGRIDLSYTGGGAYVSARAKGLKIVPLVTAVLQGRTYYKSCLITQPNSPIKTIKDMKGHTFAFVSTHSTSGGVGPRYFLGKNGISPEKDFKKFLYAGTHDAVMLAVINNKVESGAVGDIFFQRWKDRGMVKFDRYDEPNNVLVNGQFRIIDCIKVPGTPMIAREALGKENLKKLQDAFVNMPKEATEKLKYYGATQGFNRASHADYVDLAAMKKMAKAMKKKK